MTRSWKRSLSGSSRALPDYGGHWKTGARFRKRYKVKHPKRNEHHWQEPLQNGINPDKHCHTGAGSCHFGKGIELSEEEATFDDGNRKAATNPVQVPEDKLEETFTSMTPEELEYGEDEPEDDASDAPRASGSSFDEIDDAVKTAKNPEATRKEREKAAKVFTEMEGTELYDK